MSTQQPEFPARRANPQETVYYKNITALIVDLLNEAHTVEDLQGHSETTANFIESLNADYQMSISGLPGLLSQNQAADLTGLPEPFSDQIDAGYNDLYALAQQDTTSSPRELRSKILVAAGAVQRATFSQFTFWLDSLRKNGSIATCRTTAKRVIECTYRNPATNTVETIHIRVSRRRPLTGSRRQEKLLPGARQIFSNAEINTLPYHEYVEGRIIGPARKDRVPRVACIVLFGEYGLALTDRTPAPVARSMNRSSRRPRTEIHRQLDARRFRNRRFHRPAYDRPTFRLSIMAAILIVLFYITARQTGFFAWAGDRLYSLLPMSGPAAVSVAQSAVAGDAILVSSEPGAGPDQGQDELPQQPEPQPHVLTTVEYQSLTDTLAKVQHDVVDLDSRVIAAAEHSQTLVEQNNALTETTDDLRHYTTSLTEKFYHLLVESTAARTTLAGDISQLQRTLNDRCPPDAVQKLEALQQLLPELQSEVRRLQTVVAASRDTDFATQVASLNRRINQVAAEAEHRDAPASGMTFEQQTLLHKLDYRTRDYAFNIANIKGRLADLERPDANNYLASPSRFSRRSSYGSDGWTYTPVPR